MAKIIDLDKLKSYITQHQAISRDQIRPINYSNLLNCAEELNKNYLRLSSIIQHRVPLTDRSLEDNQLTFLQLDEEFKSVSELCLMPRDAILLIVKAVNVKEPLPCKEDGPIYPAELPSAIRNPPKFKYGNIKWSVGQHRPIAQYRYIYNFDINHAREVVAKAEQIKKVADVMATDIPREANLIKFYLDKVLNQTRSINIARMCLAQVLLMKVRALEYSWHTCCTDEDNPAIWYIQKLLEPYVQWPFLDTTTGMYYPTNAVCSTQVPLLLYSILNRGYSWTLGAISTSMFNLCVRTYYEWAITSLDDSHLEQKGTMNAVRKLLNERMKKSTIMLYSAAGIGGIHDVTQFDEFWLTETKDGVKKPEKDELLRLVRETSTTRDYFNYLEQLLKGTYTRDQIILLKIGLGCVTNNSTFKKSSPTLEYDRSAEHKVHNPIMQPAAAVVYNGFAVIPRFMPHSHLKVLWDILVEMIPQIKLGLEKRNFEHEFWDRLTNNSGGLTNEAIMTKKRTDPVFKAMPSIPYGQRYVSALLDNDVLYNKELAIASISERIKAGKREQIDRRSRWIMMVSNTLQVAFSVALSFSREIGKLSPFIASGKQTGDIRDMLDILRATADEFTIITDNDIKGMDSSVQEQLTSMLSQVLLHALDGLDIPTFFYASATTARCDKQDIHGNVIGHVEMELNAVQVFLIDILGHMRTQNYEFTEGIVDLVSYISGAVFPSGSYDTAGHHNDFQHADLIALRRTVLAAFTNMSASLEAQCLGDDRNVNVRFNQRSAKADEAMSQVISQQQKQMYDVGFISDPESSRCSATFLQQTAFYGGVEPKHARLSIVVAEQPIGRSKDPFGQIKEIGDILDEISSRSPHPENANPILLANWAVARVISLSKGISDSNRFTKRLDNMQAKNHVYKRWMKVHERGINLTIPMIGVYLPEVFGAPLPPLYLKSLGLRTPSYYMPKGSFGYWLFSKALRREITSEQEEVLVKRQREILRKSLAEKVKNELITQEKMDQIMVRDIYVPLTHMIDQELAFELGLTLTQWLFHILPKSLRLAEKDAKNAVFTKLADIGKQKQDQQRAAAASMANERLIKHGFHLPEGIAYYNQPKNRLMNAFVQKNQQSRRIGLENESIVDAIYAQIHSDKKLSFIFPEPSLMDFDVYISSETYPLSTDAEYLQKSTFGPCSQIGSTSHALTMLFGTPFGTPSHDAIVDALKGELTVGADVELILETAAKISRRNKELLDDFFTYVGIPYTSFGKVRRYIQDYSTYGLIQYTSVMNKRKHFYSSTHTSGARRLVDLIPMMVGSVKWTRLQLMIGRDWFHAFPETKYKIQIRPTAALVDRLVKH